MTIIAALLAAIVVHPVNCITVADYNTLAHEPAATQYVDGMAGAVMFGGDEMYLTRNVCTAAANMKRGYITEAKANAVFTIAHELGHIANGPDECAADLYGLAHWPAIAYRLGVRGHENYAELADLVTNYEPVYLHTALCAGGRP